MTGGEMQWAEFQGAWPSLKDEGNLARDTRLLADKASRIGSQHVPAGPAVQAEYRCVVVCFLLFARDTFDAIVRLLGAGLLIQSQALLRTLFESVAQLSYMSKDPVARARQFLAFAKEEKDRFVQGAKRIGAEAGIEVDKTNPDGASTEGGGAAGGDPRRKHKIQLRWHGMSFRGLLDQVCKAEPEWRDYYKILYVPASQLAHSSTTAVLQYRHLDPDAGQFGPSKGARSARMIVLLAAYLLLRATAVVEEACSLGLGELLRELDRRFNEMALARKEGGPP